MSASRPAFLLTRSESSTVRPESQRGNWSDCICFVLCILGNTTATTAHLNLNNYLFKANQADPVTHALHLLASHSDLICFTFARPLHILSIS